MVVFGAYNNCVLAFIVYFVCVLRANASSACAQKLWSDFQYEKSNNCSLVTNQYLRSNSCSTPIITFITVPSPKAEVYVLPGKVAVKRCDGFCFANAECVGDKTEIVPIPVKLVNIATDEKECGVIYMSQDVTCRCRRFGF